MFEYMKGGKRRTKENTGTTKASTARIFLSPVGGDDQVVTPVHDLLPNLAKNSALKLALPKTCFSSKQGKEIHH